VGMGALAGLGSTLCSKRSASSGTRPTKVSQGAEAGEAALVHCTKCGVKAQEDDAYCAKCGNPLRTQVAHQLSKSEEDKREAIPSQLAYMKKGLAMSALGQAAAHPTSAESRGWFQKAAEQLADVAKDLPNDAEVWNGLGTCYVNLGQPERAIDAFLVVTRIAPESSEAWGFLGNQYVALGKLDEGAQALREATRLNPSDAFALADLGTIYLRKGEPANAVHVLEEALRHLPPAKRLAIIQAATGIDLRAMCEDLLRQAKRA